MSKIMIVDDNRDMVRILQKIMKKDHHEIDVAYNGDEFLKKVGTAKPEVVLLDVMMPGIKTRDILSELKRRNLDDLKVILVTAIRLSDEQVRSLANEYNIVDYITKPFDALDLLIRVRNTVRGS
ncbi:MAG TPA: response regulator [Archaeoglobaceae archaeon]|nr:response regulator [Archaeoglobaceae archaeon]